MSDPKTLTTRELLRRIQQTNNAYEARELSRELRERAEASARKREEESQLHAAAAFGDARS